MNEPLDELYLRWLHDLVVSPGRRAKSRSHWSLLRKMYITEFIWFIPNDDNRIEDGKALRYEFLEATYTEVDAADWLDLGCSFLELLIGISRHLSFDTDIPAKNWFWHLVTNMGLMDQNDRDYVDVRVEEAIETVIWRTYEPNGRGGLFPLHDPQFDQTQVEIWYQMSAYLLELE